MKLTGATLALVCLADLISAKILIDGSNTLSREAIRSRTNVVINHEKFHRRFAQPDAAPAAVAAVSSSPMAAPPAAPSSASTPSSNDTKTACVQVLDSLNGVSASATGMSVCYNVMYLDEKSGEFEGDVLIYQVAPATGNWSSVQPKSMRLSLAYPGATVADMSSMARKRDNFLSKAISPRLSVRTSHAVLVTNMSFVGEVEQVWLDRAANNQTTMMQALAPKVTIRAVTQSGDQISDTLPDSEAGFINGNFAAKAAAARKDAQKNAANPPFVLPGTTLGIFPVGLIITGVWTLLFVVVVGLGTFGRLQFRKAFRRKTQASSGSKGKSGGVAAYDQR